jgi:1-acyl-sn-glycerol-3-phosphate acyltransferase
MNFAEIDKKSFKYTLLRAYTKFAQNVIFYRKVLITGKENIPENIPLFFAPNHQNALMDALIVLCNVKQQPVFIARADIFKNSIIAKILIFLKILPAYRIRDGKENLGKNEEIFDTSVKILENKHILALFPETTHTGFRQLQILKKAVQRIVFQAEEKNNYSLGTKVLPIGIYYSSYWNFRSDVLVNFGKPMDMNEFNQIYKENPQRAMLVLRDRLAEEIKKLIIHIPSTEYYNLYEIIREFYNKSMLSKLSLKKSFYNSFIADRKTIDCLDNFERNEPEKIKQLNIQATEYKHLLDNLKLRNWVLDRNAGFICLLIKSLGLAILSPVFLYGWINNLLPYYLPVPIRKKIKDPQFISSVNFVLGLILYPVLYILQFSLVWIFSEVWWIKYMYLLSLPFSGLAAFNIHRLYVKLKSQWKFLLIKKSGKYGELLKLKNNIQESMDDLTEIYLSITKK